MNPFENQLKELANVLEGILEKYSDEELEERSEAIINGFYQALNAEDAQMLVNEVIKDIDIYGYNPNEVMEQITNVQIMLANTINEIKAKYPNSIVKQTLCDMMENAIDAFFVNFVGKLANRDGVNIGVELAHPNAKIPTYAHNGDQGADLYAVEEMIIQPHTYGNLIPTGIKVIIPPDWALAIRPRSGLSKNSTLRISNAPATIDQLYRGEIKVLMDNIGDAPVTIKPGERIAQMILERNYHAVYHQVDSVDPDTERGEGGFGSSGN